MTKVFFVTLSRSDYASLRPVALAAIADKEIEAKIIVGGSHLLSRYGNSIEQIKNDRIIINFTTDFLKETDDTPENLACAYARAVQNFVDIFTTEKPDYVFIIGDRWEMLAVVSAASILQIPVVHHSGGDITQGSSDNQTRYALTSLSHIHLVALEEHRDRLLRMGEEKWRVLTVGEPALTELQNFANAIPNIHQYLEIDQDKSFVLATYHPTSFDNASPEKQIDLFLNVLDNISDNIILTAPNPDSASGMFFHKFQTYAKTHKNIKIHENLGTSAYYAAMSKASFMIGNSSSGLWESPSFGLPVINIGPRQQGRVHSTNVINVTLDINDIIKYIKLATSPEFKEIAKQSVNPYVRNDTIDLILNILKQPYNKQKLLSKHFVDPLCYE